MPANKYALLRYRIIDRCLRNKYRPFPDKEELRQACEEELYGSEGDRVSMSTIEKDLYAMRNEVNLGYFAPIAYNKLEKGYYYEDPDYGIDEFPLNSDDIEAIEFAAKTLAQFRDIPLFESSGDAIDKILGRVSLRPPAGEEREAFVQFETATEYRGSRHLKTILRAIREKKTVQFEYVKFSGDKGKRYTLHPYLLKEYRNRWYMIGFNPDKSATVVFGLDRITGEIEITSERFQKSLSFDPDLYFKYSLGITVVDDEPETVRLRFAALTGKYVESQPLHQSQKIIEKTEDYIDVELTVCLTRELIMTILSFGSGVEVMAPENLRRNILDELIIIINQYDQFRLKSGANSLT